MSKDINSLHLDTQESEQIPGTYRFLLNGVDEVIDGADVIANEESNEQFLELPLDYVLLHKLYIGNNEHVLFLVMEDESLSQLGLINANGVYKTLVITDLGFKLHTKIDAIYRLRRGCERTIYWVDPKPRVFNLDKPEDYKLSGIWQPGAFNLFKTYEAIPVFNKIEVLENGNLAAGSYNASIQYLDRNLNPTEWITSSDTILINHDSLSKEYKLLRGSTNVETGYQKFGLTNKSIKFTFSGLDETYPYYRVAIVMATSGTGRVSEVVYSQEISTQVPVYEFSGASTGLQVGTEQELQQFNNIIDSAEHIEQLENRLVLAGTKGKQYNFCELQKYASKIKADLALKEVILNASLPSNAKNATVHIEGTGYMPGEIYSFGIVYVFADNTTSPVFHIPGKALSEVSRMSHDNKCENAYYTAVSSSCEDKDYWGLDHTGVPLVNQPIRHHRFPLRSELNEPLLREEANSDNELTLSALNVLFTGELKPEVTEDFPFIIRYSIGDNNYVYEGLVDVSAYRQASNPKISLTLATDTAFINIDKIEENGVLVTNLAESAFSGLMIKVEVESKTVTVNNKVIKSNIFGIRFSNIEVPKLSAGEDIIGYYIVRNERDQDNKSIMDSAVLTPLITHDHFVASGYASPKVADNRVKNDVVAVLHPEHKFLQKEYKNVSEVIQEGYYSIEKYEDTNSITEDVMTGTSYDSDTAKKREKDNDGFDLNLVSRNNKVKYNKEASTFATKDQIAEIFYLDSLNSKTVLDSSNNKKEVFNVSCDNKMGILQMKVPYAVSKVKNRMPYVILKRKLANPYANFRILPYYRESKNFVKFMPRVDSTTLFSGDSYISPMRYTTSVYYDTRLRKRDSKSGWFNTVVGVLGIIAGAALIATGVGAAAGVALAGTAIAGIAGSAMVIGFGLSQLSTGLKKEQISKVYSELYDAGLRNTVKDSVTDKYFSANPVDDQVQWSIDHVTDLWFESSVNMGLRQGSTGNVPDFLDAPALESTLNELKGYGLEKLTVLDSDNANGRLYRGHATAELYEINLDYLRKNRQKIYFALGIEYDCCSDCRESFPHRYHYSEQAFQEELSDNYRTFLPNNYRDLDGETGVITDLFKIQNNLYLHTENALWHIPQNIQERVTGDIVSFIGTGDFFGISPRKMVDDAQNSAGTVHKQGTLKTKYGVFFISENESKIYQFDGQKLDPISDQGLFTWFKSNLKLKSAQQFHKATGRVYGYNGNTSLFLGNGFISVYDSRKERIIFTKKDFTLQKNLRDNPDFELYLQGNDQLLIFRDYQAQINNKRNLGYDYRGIGQGKMVFSKLIREGELMKVDFQYVDGQAITKEEVIEFDNSWTLSYSLKKQAWRGWHSYSPNMYIHIQDEFYSWTTGERWLYKYNKTGSYQIFNGKYYPHILEYVKVNPKGEVTLWEDVKFYTQAEQYDKDSESFYEARFETFNKFMAYNRRQCTGLQDLVCKDTEADQEDYILHQISNTVGKILIDKNELHWSMNDLRDYVNNYTKPIFNRNIEALAVGYYIDKVLNETVIDFDKDWTEVESFRDKYIVLRFIFDNFEKQNIRLITQYSEEFKTLSS